MTAAPLGRVNAKIAIKNAGCKSLRLRVYGEFDCEFDYDSQEWSCAQNLVEDSYASSNNRLADASTHASHSSRVRNRSSRSSGSGAGQRAGRPARQPESSSTKCPRHCTASCPPCSTVTIGWRCRGREWVRMRWTYQDSNTIDEQRPHAYIYVCIYPRGI